MTRLPLFLFLAAIALSFLFFLTRGNAEVITSIMAGACAVAGVVLMVGRGRMATFAAVVRVVWFNVTLALSAAAALIVGVYFVTAGGRLKTGFALTILGVALTHIFMWRDVRRNSAPDKIEVRQLTSDITPQIKSLPDVGEERKLRAQRLTNIRRNAQKKGYGV